MAAGGKLAANCCCENPCESWANPPANWPTAVVSISSGGSGEGSVAFDTFDECGWPVCPREDDQQLNCYWRGNGPGNWKLYISYSHESRKWYAAYIVGCTNYGDLCDPPLGNLCTYGGFGQDYAGVGCDSWPDDDPGVGHYMVELADGSIGVSDGKLSGSFVLEGFSPGAFCDNPSTDCPQMAGKTATITVGQE